MKVIFQFNPKSSGQNVSIAINLVKECGGIIEDNYCEIEFNSIEDKNFRKLYDLVGNLKDSEIAINERDPINTRLAYHVLTCPYKFLCEPIFEDNISNLYHIDRDDLDIKESNNEFIDHLLINDIPEGYICKKIRVNDGEVVDVFYSPFEEALKIWEDTDFLREDYVINTIKSVYEKDEASLIRTVKKLEKRYNTQE